jgi:cytochrome c5
MKSIFGSIVLVAFVMFLATAARAEDKPANKYVGVKICAPCHKSEKTGNQFGIWQKSKHSEAYKVLTTAKADEIAKAKGSKKPAAESPECLECHSITAAPALLEKTFDVKDGNQCELCHGAGSGYKNMAIMKDKAKAIAAGLTEYKDDAAIEAKCKTCHNDKSPTFKEFKFKESWPKIKHLLPKKG